MPKEFPRERGQKKKCGEGVSRGKGKGADGSGHGRDDDKGGPEEAKLPIGAKKTGPKLLGESFLGKREEQLVSKEKEAV